MPSFTTKRRVPFSAGQMFAVVADVERYPQFLPLCEKLEVTSRAPAEGARGATVISATMTVGYKSIREAFTTRVTLDQAANEIRVQNLDGLFRHLENRWRFVDAPGGSDIDFFIDYEFRSSLLGLVMGAAFDHAVRRYSAAFEARARALYAPGI